MISTADFNNGINISEIIKVLKAGNGTDFSKKDDVNGFLDKNLNENDARRIKNVLADENKTKAILESDAARELLKKLTGGDFGG